MRKREAEAAGFYGSATKKSTASASIFFKELNQIEQLSYRQLYLQKMILKNCLPFA